MRQSGKALVGRLALVIVFTGLCGWTGLTLGPVLHGYFSTAVDPGNWLALRG